MIARIDDDGAGFLPALILNDPISRARIARLGLRCYATRQRQGYQRDERAARRVIHLIAHDLSLKLSVRQHQPCRHEPCQGDLLTKGEKPSLPQIRTRWSRPGSLVRSRNRNVNAYSRFPTKRDIKSSQSSTRLDAGDGGGTMSTAGGQSCAQPPNPSHWLVFS